MPAILRRALAQAPLVFTQAIELTGPSARSGDTWRNGVEMAVQEINAVGGVQGRPLQVYTYDVSNGRAAVQRALEGDPVALLGPVTSAAARLAAPLVRAARLLHIIGADAPGLAVPGGNVFRAGPGLTVRMPRLAAWMHAGLALRRVSLVWSNDEFGRAGRDLLLHEIRGRGIELVSDHPVIPGPAGYGTEIAALARTAPEAVVVYLEPAECVRFLREAQQRALRAMLVGESTLAAPRVLEQAGAAAEGVRCHVSFAPEAIDVTDFRKRYAGMFKSDPDTPAAKGYTAVGMLAAAIAQIGRPARDGLTDALRGMTLRAGAAAMMLDSTWDAAGEMNRETFLVEVREGHPVVVGSPGRS